jgi:predicted metal-dependent enzyme (double-stranded beta helix superfamily)
VTGPLECFIAGMEDVIDRPEDRLVPAATALLLELIAPDTWLPDDLAAPHPQQYRQYLLHRDADARFTVVSFVWGPGQSTPIHDHCTWGLVGVLRGAELSTRYELHDTGLVPTGPAELLAQGCVDAVSPTLGDIHQVANARAGETSVSIHVYGGDIGTIRRHTYALDGTIKPFVSGYSNAVPAEGASVTR